jgi:hypothetical protein
MRKILFILLFVISATLVAAENVQMNYSIEVKTYNDSNLGRFELIVDGNNWGSADCDGSSGIHPTVQVVKSVNCGAIQQSTTDNLAGYMSTFIDKFNDTRVYLFQNYADCTRELSNCKISNAHQVEMIENCNGTNSDWYTLYKDSQARLDTIRTQVCYDQQYVDTIKKDNGDNMWKAVGVTAIIAALIGYILYFKKGLAKNPYHST